MKIKRLSVFLLLCFLFTYSSAAEIAVVKSKDIEPYNAAISGFKKVVRDKVSENDMDGDIKKGIAITDKLKLERPNLVLSLGAEASYIVTQNIKTIPIVFSMVSNPSRYNIGNSNTTGVRLDIPIKTQLHLYKEILPDAKRIGIIYSDENTKRLIDEAKIITAGFDMEIVSIWIKDIRGLPEALEDIISKIDSLWLLFDPVVTSSQRIVQEVIIFKALQKKIPVVGFNKWSVTAGSLYCLYSEYEDIGRQTGEIAGRILRGENPSSIPMESPRDVKILFNNKVLDRVASKGRVNMPEKAYVWGGE
jgi:putative ABC transport system substrate-binding protein